MISKLYARPLNARLILRKRTPALVACLVFSLPFSLTFSLPACRGGDSDETAESTPASQTLIQSMLVLGDSTATGVYGDSTVGQEYQIALRDNAISLSPNSVFLNQVATSIDPQDFVEFDVASIAPQLFTVEFRNGLQQSYIDQSTNAFTDPSESSAFSISTRLGLNRNQWINQAVFGHRLSDVLAELNTQSTQDRLQAADYLVINVGGNDYCATDFDLDSFATDLDSLVEQLLQYRNLAFVTLMPSPAVFRVFELNEGSAVGFTLDSAGEKTPLTCETLRGEGNEGGGLCPYMAPGTRESSEQQLARLTAINDAIKAAASSLFSQWAAAGVSTQVSFPQQAGTPEILAAADWIGIDCFHPGLKGQTALANEAWADIADFLAASADSVADAP